MVAASICGMIFFWRFTCQIEIEPDTDVDELIESDLFAWWNFWYFCFSHLWTHREGWVHGLCGSSTISQRANLIVPMITLSQLSFTFQVKIGVTVLRTFQIAVGCVVALSDTPPAEVRFNKNSFANQAGFDRISF